MNPENIILFLAILGTHIPAFLLGKWIGHRNAKNSKRFVKNLRLPMAEQAWELEGVGTVFVKSVDLNNDTITYHLPQPGRTWNSDSVQSAKLSLFMEFAEVSKSTFSWKVSVSEPAKQKPEQVGNVFYLNPDNAPKE